MRKQVLIPLKVIGLALLLLTFNYIPIEIFNLDYENFTKIQLILYYLLCDLIFLIILLLIYKKTIIKDFTNFKKKFLDNLEVSFKYWIIGVIIMMVSNILIVIFAPESTASNEEAVRDMIDMAPLYMLFSVAIYAPLTEELIFRKGFREMFQNKWLYILTSGLVFGSLHVISSLKSYYDLLYLIPYCSLGITFAYTYYKTNNIFSTIFMHSIHNTLTIGIYLLGTML